VRLMLFIIMALFYFSAGPSAAVSESMEANKSTATSTLYVCDQDRSRLVVIDTATGQIIREIKTPKSPAMIAKSKSGNRIFVTHPDIGELSVVDSRTDNLADRYYVSGEPFGVASLDEDTLVYSDWKSGFVIKYNTATAEIVAQVYVGHSLAHLVHDEKHKRIYVAIREDDAVAIIDESNFSILSKVPVGRAPFAIAIDPDNTWIVVGNVRSGTLSIIDSDKLTLIQTVKAGVAPYGLAIASKGNAVLVTDQEENSLRIFDTSSFTEKAKIAVGRFPEGVTIDPVLDKAFVSNWFSGDISVIDLKSMKQAKLVKFGGSPRASIMIDR